MINFEDTNSVFAHKSNWELKKSYYLFSILKYSLLVKIGSLLLRVSFFLRLPINKLIKLTIFNQFCGGENIQDCTKKINELSDFGIGTILDYSVEGKENESDFEKTKDEVIQTILFSANSSKIPFTVFKITGLGKSSIIEKASRDFNSLNDTEILDISLVSKRVDEICKVASEKKVSVFIDAEDSWYQNYIDQVVETMILKYNNKFPIVYNTIQLYRHDRLQYMKDLITRCNFNDKHLGLKLVRGAYMEKEREVAAKKNYEDPIQVDKAATDYDFTKAVEYCLENIETIQTINKINTDPLSGKKKARIHGIVFAGVANANLINYANFMRQLTYRNDGTTLFIPISGHSGWIDCTVGIDCEFAPDR